MPPPPQPAAYHDSRPHVLGQGRFELDISPRIEHPNGVAIKDAAGPSILGMDLQAWPLIGADVRWHVSVRRVQKKVVRRRDEQERIRTGWRLLAVAPFTQRCMRW